MFCLEGVYEQGKQGLDFCQQQGFTQGGDGSKPFAINSQRRKRQYRLQTAWYLVNFRTDLIDLRRAIHGVFRQNMLYDGMPSDTRLRPSPLERRHRIFRRRKHRRLAQGDEPVGPRARWPRKKLAKIADQVQQ